MRTETDGLDTHLTVKYLLAYLDRLVCVHHFLGEGAFDRVAGENDAVSWVGGPFDEQFTTGTILQHAWRGHDDQRSRRFCHRLQLVILLELKGVVPTFKLHPQLVTHHIPMHVEHVQSPLGQVSLMVYRDVGNLGVLRPILVQDQQ